MKRRRTTRLVVVLVGLAAVAVAILAVGAPGARTRVRDASRPSVLRPTTEPAVGTARDPEVRWANPVRGEPDGVTVAGSDVATVEFDEVRLLDLASGAVKWRVELPGIARARAVFTADRVIVATRDAVVLLDRATGRRVGAVQFAEAEHLALTQSTDRRDLVVATNLDGEIAGIDVAATSERWSLSYPGSIVDPPAADDGIVVAHWEDGGRPTMQRAFSATTGELGWEADVGEYSTGPAMAGGRVFAAGGPSEAGANFVARRADDGKVLWWGGFPAPWDESGAPLVSGDTVYLLDRAGTVTAVDVESGQPRWQTHTHTAVLYARMVANARTLVFQTFDDHVVAVDRATGKVVAGTSEDAFPIDVDATDDTLVVALRRGAPSRIEARPAP
jgi:outer membrane protein assembly factor BamB